MLSDADSTWHVPESTPQVRSFRSSLYLRRRVEGLGPKVQEGDGGARLSMPAEVCDFLDLARDTSGMAAAGHAHEGSHSNMLYALLSSLPEPPLSQPRNSVVDTLSALADELPQPPLSPTMSPPLSPMAPPPMARSLVASPIEHSPATPPLTHSPATTPPMTHSPATPAATVAAVKEQAVAVLEALGALETPASSRRNTDEVPLSQQQELRRLSATPTLLDEMPPKSPFFADIADHDIHRTRNSIRNAKLARSRSLGATRTTWCAPDAEPMFSSLHHSNKTPARMSLAGILDAWTLGPRDDEATEWLSARPPSAAAADRCEPVDSCIAEAPTRVERWFQVCVHSLFARGAAAARASVDELSDAASTTSSLTAVDDGDPDMHAALARHPAALALRNKPLCAASKLSETRIQRPTRLVIQRARRHAGPALSFLVSSRGPTKADCAAQSMDVEAMVAAYLPHVYAQLGQSTASVDATRERTASESSTLADPGYASSSQRSESSEDTLQSARTPVRMSPPQSLLEQRRKSARRSDTGKPVDSFTFRTPNNNNNNNNNKPRMLRQAASSANIRASEPMAEQQRRQRVHTVSQLAAPATLASRRRSEVEALITQANAVLNSSSETLRRGSRTQQQQQQPISRLRPPRASLPLSVGMPRRTNSIVISPRNSVLSASNPRISTMSASNPRISTMSDNPRISTMSDNPRISIMSDSAVSRIPSPVSALRAPTTPLSMAMSRQHYRLESAQQQQRRQSNRSSGEISPLALTPVHASIGVEISSCTLPLPRRSRPSISLSGLRPPISNTSSSSSRIPTTPSYKRPPPGMAAPRGASSSMVATPGSGGLAGMRRNAAPQHSQLRRLGSSAMLRTSSIGYSTSSSSLMHSVCSTDSEDSLPGLTGLPPRRAPSRGYRDDEFLTLRPVHTPDIVPRTIDPRLVERAMTPMLKLNSANNHHLASASSLSQMVQHISDDTSNSSIASIQSPTKAPLDKCTNALDTVHEVRSPSIDKVSHMSPLNSPKLTPTVRPSADSSTSRRFGKPGFLSRRWTRHSNSPVPVSAIPMPPPDKQQPAKKPVSSKIPSLKKARSLWSIRGLQSK